MEFLITQFLPTNTFLNRTEFSTLPLIIHPLEINFLGLMEERWYPNEKFWKIAGEEGNTAVFGCDAHTPKAVWNPETEQKALQLAAKYGLKVQETVPMPKTF